ncbi:DUF58 domain-containing protein [Persicobacter diffluens]|uniref:DUF58 domain-containing protein n=1 Tax=Persicobacter diffluens TaxID=981 RepID=A0AAN5AKC0_9BACT|nr:hypothetical protein PEDI_24360 [Persicobacter diffluens]
MMERLNSIWKELYQLNFSMRFYLAAAVVASMSVLGFWIAPLYWLSQLLLLAWVVISVFEFILLFFTGNIQGERQLPNRFSNGDTNPVKVSLISTYRFPTILQWLDEIPDQISEEIPLQQVAFSKQQQQQFQYLLQPVERGAYHFGYLRVVAQGFLGLVERHFKLASPQEVACYPSFVHLRQYELMAQNTAFSFGGVKKFRRIGQQKEFDQIREYIIGDDIRNVNWAATARKADLMVNQYQDEKAQQVVALIDGGRNMKASFNGMDLVDYAINSTLVLLNVAYKKKDLVGLHCHDQSQRSWIKPSRQPMIINTLQEQLYKFRPSFEETDFSGVYTHLRRQLSQRSMVLLFTNFESELSLERQLPYFRKMAARHLLVVVLFTNTEVESFLEEEVVDESGAYLRGVVEKMANEKQLMVKKLRQYGIHPILTAPENLTVSALNKYLEFKARGMI